MKTLEESVVAAMETQEMAIFPFLPYILQDFWEIGTPPEGVINLVKKHCKNIANLHVLDLGSGKGAISVKLAAALKCHCYGIDGIVEFVEASKEKAREYGVETLCRFEAGDVRKKIEELGTFDVIILGATGPIFEDYCTALTRFSKHLTADGMIIINEGYTSTPYNPKNSTYSSILSRKELLKQFGQAGMELVDEHMDNSEDFDKEIENIQTRCNELKAKYPEKSSLFEKYIQEQVGGYDDLKNKVDSSMMVLKRVKT